MLEVYTSDSSDSDSREQKTFNLGRSGLTTKNADDVLLAQSASNKKSTDIETVLINNNRISDFPATILKFVNLKVLDISSNSLTRLPEEIVQLPLITLIVKNNLLTNKSLPKSLNFKNGNLKELNLSGNMLTHFPDQALELKSLRYLYLGANKISNISKDIWKMSSLQILSLGGNLIAEVPETVGSLHHLQALTLCDNAIENLPTSIGELRNLKSLLLHRNRLKHLPRNIITLKNLTELSLRDNPLVVRFVQDMALNPPSLLELAARTVRTSAIEYGPQDVPMTLVEYLRSANCCVNPKCRGVFFDNRVEHIKFVDFCGKYRVPLMQYLCSSKCIEPTPSSSHSEPGASGYMMRKVLLG
ncbi:unnamed protein product [Hermetia illucens]|uniref:Leucine-rich repeat-containing protein 58 n=1 Tax=Hermetia illucens TaxID=343691 RepID=A0A7R8YWK8_HERIL|nr:leucine-rich repeat-containing protein 58 [Hermetia illucens]CAD7087455.1 unnamed protein product [Hermetia illucens]